MEEIIAIFGVDWRLLFIQTINFGLLLLVLWYFLYRPVVRMIEIRQKKIAKGIEDAECAERELKEVEGKRKEILTKAAAEAEVVLQNTVSHARGQERGIVEEAQRRSVEVLADAKAKAEEIKQRTLAESKEEIARMVVLGAERILREKA